MCLILALKVIGGVQVVVAPKISQRFVVIMEADAATPRKDDTDSILEALSKSRGSSVLLG